MPDCYRARPEEIGAGAQGERPCQGAFELSEARRGLNRRSHYDVDGRTYNNDRWTNYDDHSGTYDHHDCGAHNDDCRRPYDDHDVADHDFDGARRPHEQHDRFADDIDGGTVTGG
jgi:hypothetical protein